MGVICAGVGRYRLVPHPLGYSIVVVLGTRKGSDPIISDS
jgi:hypothetical protein